MVLETLIGLVLAANAPPSPAPPPDQDQASRELLLYLAEFDGGGDDAVDPLELEHADLPRRDPAPQSADPHRPDPSKNTDHAAPHPDPPPR